MALAPQALLLPTQTPSSHRQEDPQALTSHFVCTGEEQLREVLYHACQAPNAFTCELPSLLRTMALSLGPTDLPSMPPGLDNNVAVTGDVTARNLVLRLANLALELPGCPEDALGGGGAELGPGLAGIGAAADAAREQADGLLQSLVAGCFAEAAMLPGGFTTAGAHAGAAHSGQRMLWQAVTHLLLACLKGARDAADGRPLRLAVNAVRWVREALSGVLQAGGEQVLRW